MTTAVLFRREVALRMGLLGTLAGALVTTGCHIVEYVYPKNLQAFTLPDNCPRGKPPSTSAELSACLEGLEFDTTEAIGDEQRLLVRDDGGPPCHDDKTHTCRYGPLAKVEPAKGAEMYSERSLAEGRIIARIYLRAHETERYPKYGLVPVDTTYWWVNSTISRSYFVHRNGTRAELDTLSRGLQRTPHPPGTFQQAFAAWIWDEKDETLNGGCSGHCCKS
jgi:hypothetical protein